MTITTTLGEDAVVNWIMEGDDDVTVDERRLLNQLWDQGPLSLTDVSSATVGLLLRRGMVLTLQGRVHLTERGFQILARGRERRA